MTNKTPQISLGLPVYNGENFISEAIESILSQTFTDFELIITDNVSTDRTQQICESYAALDPRVFYFRNKENLGAASNFIRAFELSSGKYFKWVAHDDVIAPEFLEKCATVLDHDPSVVLCFTNVIIINEEGAQIDEYDINLNTYVSDPSERFRSLIIDWHMCFDVFGLIRSDVLRQTEVMGNYGHGDGVLLAHLGLIGKFYRIPEYLFYSRRHSQQSMRMFGYSVEEGGNDYHAYAEWFDSSNSGKLIFPQWRILKETYKIIWQVYLPWNARLRTHLYLLWWSIKMRRHLWSDLRIAGKWIYRRKLNK
jgi:glycosyltransferase involved in cell wall biosynthesis